MEESINNDLIFGIHPILEAIKSKVVFDKILIQEQSKHADILFIRNHAKQNGISLSIVPKSKLNRVTSQNHQGVIGFIAPIEFADYAEIVSKCFEEGKNPFLLVLDKITDVRNFGAICRTAECVGVDAIIIPKKGAAQINDAAVKTSAGALMRIPVCKVKILTETVKDLQRQGIKIVSCTEKSDTLYSEFDYDCPVALVMGSEEKGISREIINNSDFKAKLPMHGHIESLNVSVAAGVMMYEILKGRK